MIRKFFFSILLLVFIDTYAIGQGSMPEVVYLFQLKPSAGATPENCFLPQYENGKVTFTFTSKDTLARLETFIEDEFPVLETDCFFPNLKIVHKNFTYVLSVYCGVILKFKNIAPYQTSNVKLANDFIFTESLIAYFINLEKKFFSDVFIDFYQSISSKIPSASNLYSHSLELFPTIDTKYQSEPNKDIAAQPAIKTDENDKSMPKSFPVENKRAEKQKALIEESGNQKDATERVAAISAENEKLIASLPQIINPYEASIPVAPLFFSESMSFIAPLQPENFLFQARFETEGPLTLTLQEGISAQKSPIQMASLSSSNKLEKTSSSSFLAKQTVSEESISTFDNLNWVPQEKISLAPISVKSALAQNAALVDAFQESIKTKALEDSTVHKPLKPILPWFSPNKTQEVNHNYVVAVKPEVFPVDFNFNALPIFPKPTEQGLSLPKRVQKEIITIETAAKPTLTSPLSTNAKENNPTSGASTVAVAPQPTPVNNVAAAGAVAEKPAPTANIAPPSLSRGPTASSKQVKPAEDDDLEAEDDPTKNIEEEDDDDTEEGDLNIEELEVETGEENMEELDADLEEDMEEDLEEEDSDDEDF
jgi:hypothetical protein